MPKDKYWVPSRRVRDRPIRPAWRDDGETRLTDFVVDAAVTGAERVLAGRTQLVLDPVEWARFVELLDRPPRDQPWLEKLLSQPNVFAVTRR